MNATGKHGGRGRSPLARIATATLVVFLLGGGYAIGAVPNTKGELTLCFDAARATKTGVANLKIADLELKPAACSSRGLASVTINQQGPVGPAGPAGPAGGGQGTPTTTTAATVQQQNAPALIQITREPGAITVATLTARDAGRHIAFGQIVASGTVTAYQSARCWIAVNGQLPKTDPIGNARFGGAWAATVPASRTLLLNVGDVVNYVCDAFGDRVFGTNASLILQHIPGTIPPGS